MVKKAPTKKAPAKAPAKKAAVSTTAINRVLKHYPGITANEVAAMIKKGDLKAGSFTGYGPALHKALCITLDIPIENNQIQKKPGKSANGGARKGSGRKLGSATKKTREIADKIAETGQITPLEYMMNTLNTTPDSLKVQFDKGEIDLEQYTVGLQNLQQRRDQAAKDAASYMHPRLASINANIKTDEQAEWIDRMLALEAATKEK